MRFKQTDKERKHARMHLRLIRSYCHAMFNHFYWCEVIDNWRPQPREPRTGDAVTIIQWVENDKMISTEFVVTDCTDWSKWTSREGTNVVYHEWVFDATSEYKASVRAMQAGIVAPKT